MRIDVSTPILKERARSLRRAATPAEAVLWDHLRSRRLAGLRFTRQRPIGSYIIDFYCPERGLVIEIDGPQHSLPEKLADDEERTTYLEGRGLRVVRFRNEEVLTRTEQVLLKIRDVVSPSP
jgi:very-short-patch-repair endonuclease